MCGIAGCIHLDGRPITPELDGPILRGIGDALHHRGPDDTQLMLWENVGFVFKRLSIVDIEGGRQPFETPDGRVSAMINGEIFNHRDIRRSLLPDAPFHSSSDCEVIPYLYLQRDLELFEPANGMFAMALLDRAKRRVLLGRDRHGVKPLFYCVADNGRTLVFASELKALFAHPAVPRKFDWLSALGRDGSGDTFAHELGSGFCGIERVPAAALMDISLNEGTFSISKYWQLPERPPAGSGQPAEYYVERYRELLEESVRMRLMADAGYGVFLSGGIDSSVITAIAAKSASFPTFSVLSKSTVGSGDAQASQFLARKLGLPNHQVFFDHRSTLITPDDWRRVLWSCEMHEVTAEQLYKYFLHAYAKQRYPDLKVILLGQGSDEFNGGYTDWTLNTVARGNAVDPDPWSAIGNYFDAVEIGHRAIKDGYFGSYHDLIDQQIIDPDFVRGSSGRPLRREVWDKYVGYYRQNLDYHLWHEDRTASAHSIENRVPFLDFRLVELLGQIPVQHHSELFTDKRILRRAAADWLPVEIASRPKGPFFYGKDQRFTYQLIYSLLTANSGELIEQAISGSARTDGALNPAQFRRYAADVGKEPEFKDLNRLMSLVNMGVLADLADSKATPGVRSGASPVYEITLREDEDINAVVAARL